MIRAVVIAITSVWIMILVVGCKEHRQYSQPSGCREYMFETNRYCGLPTSGGTPYCKDHRRRRKELDDSLRLSYEERKQRWDQARTKKKRKEQHGIVYCAEHGCWDRDLPSRYSKYCERHSY